MKRNVLYTCIPFLLSGCMLTAPYQPPKIPMQETWEERDTNANITFTIKSDWWEGFQSPTLTKLIVHGLTNNYEILAGLQKIKQARASLKTVKADLWPTLSGSVGSSHNKTKQANAISTNADTFSAGLNTAYEIDLFGRTSSSIQAAKETAQGALYTQEALKLVIMGDIAETYFSILSLKERLELAENNLRNAQDVHNIIQARVNAGTESELTLSQQAANVANTQASILSLKSSYKKALHALAILLGQTPNQHEEILETLADIHIPAIQPTQPSSLLTQRPDLKKAEADLKAAHANIATARAAFFPSLSLGANSNWTTPGLTDPASLVLSLSSALTQSIFDGGARRATLNSQKARKEELTATYRHTILTAFQEVEDALLSVKTAAQREEVLKTAMDQSQKAYKLSKQRYDAGSIDYQTLLDTQNTLLSAEDTYTQAKLANLTAAISLFKALGGGF